MWLKKAVQDKDLEGRLQSKILYQQVSCQTELNLVEACQGLKVIASDVDHFVVQLC